MRDNAALVQNWIKQPDPVPHDVYFCSGNLLMKRKDNTPVGVRWFSEDDDHGVIILSAAMDNDITPEFTNVDKHTTFVMQTTEIDTIIKFFTSQEEIFSASSHSSLSLERIGMWTQRAIEVVQGYGLPLPDRLLKAHRGIHYPKSVTALLAFHDAFIPNQFRYVMDASEISFPLIQYSFWTFQHFVIFSEMSDAAGAKLRSEECFIIDLQGDDIVPYPKRRSDDDDDNVPF